MKIHPCVTYQLRRSFFNLRFILFIVFVILETKTYGQKKQVITGTVKDMEKNPIPVASVELLTLNSNQLIQQVTTDSLGIFLLYSFTPDSVFVRINSLGYATFQSAPFKISADENYAMGDISLKHSKITLDEVEVSVTPPQVIQKADRTVVNLDGNVLTSGSNMLEIMSRLPGVFVDKDGNITFNSKTNILITINGKQTYMEPGDLATYLKGQPAENLKNVELFSNPPASYDATGTGGVINLNLKNGGNGGLNGSVTAGTRYNGGWSYTSAANLNYKTGKWQTRLGLSRNDYFHTEDMEIYKEFNETAVSQRSLFSQDIDWDVRTKTFLLDAAFDYTIKDGHRVGISYQLSDENRKDFRNAITDIEEVGGPATREHAVIDDVSPGTRHAVDVFYVGDLDTLGSNISADFVYIHSDKDFRSLLTVPQTIGSAVLPDGSLETLNPVLYKVYGGQGLYVFKLN
ncbi:TonB-dependent receptor [Olivibacter sp. XZL3]|uniref:TonB-dependent receptor n=1 Tax=Olivibacter sp. XZL3 TaxID=1735116 RepID=UPI001064EC23|nr:TonB-dependent receptor [Olivibacter sp. XZL3]